jgi:hypothetical protein
MQCVWLVSLTSMLKHIIAAQLRIDHVLYATQFSVCNLLRVKHVCAAMFTASLLLLTAT